MSAELSRGAPERGETHRDVVGDDREREDDEEEATKAAHGCEKGREEVSARLSMGDGANRGRTADEGSAEETAEVGRAVLVLGDGSPGLLDVEGRHHEGAERLDEDERDVEADVGGEEDLPVGRVGALVDGVVGGEGGPAEGEASDRAAELREGEGPSQSRPTTREQGRAKGGRTERTLAASASPTPPYPPCM